MEGLFTKGLIMQVYGRNRGTKERVPRILGPAAPEHYHPRSQRDKGEERLLQPGRRGEYYRAGHLEKVVMFCDVLSRSTATATALQGEKRPFLLPSQLMLPLARAQRKD